jgi:tRNA pseudouridine55 synthase
MESQDIRNAISGILVVDKPVGLTSHDVVQIIRTGTGIRRAGHTGTLDPRASGVLVVLIGPAVRLSEYVSASDKRYQAIIRLGSSTDTYDGEGRFTQQTNQPVNVTEEQFETTLKSFIGEIEQTPPAYSAIKVNGRRSYDMARKGEEVELEPRKIQVYHLEILEWAPPEVVIDAHCSSGTYVRSLANDVGNALGCGAYLVGLRRTKSGRFSLRDAIPLRKLQEAFAAGNWYQYLMNSIRIRWMKSVMGIASRLLREQRPPWCGESVWLENWWHCWNLFPLRLWQVLNRHLNLFWNGSLRRFSILKQPSR